MTQDAAYVPPDDLFPEDEDPFLRDVTSESAGDDPSRFPPPRPDPRETGCQTPENEFLEGPEAIDLDFFQPVKDWAGKPVPAREWHVENLIPARQVTLIYGDGGDGKSLLAMQLAVATASGKDWIGRPVLRSGKVLYLSAEDEDAELHRRFAAIADAECLDLGSLDVWKRSTAGEDSLLATFDRTTGMIRQTALQSTIKTCVAAMRPRLLVLDTLADLHSGNEIEKSVARQFIALQRGLAIRHDCAVVILAHPSLSGMSDGSGRSGNTAWSNSVRSRLYLERVRDDDQEPDPNIRRLSSKKNNYGPIGHEIALTWMNGRFVANETEGALDRIASVAKAERVFLKLLNEFNAEGRRVRHTTGDGYAPNAFAKSGRAEGVTKQALRVAMEGLFAKGAIRVAEEGPPSRVTRHLEEAPK